MVKWRKHMIRVSGKHDSKVLNIKITGVNQSWNVGRYRVIACVWLSIDLAYFQAYIMSRKFSQRRNVRAIFSLWSHDGESQLLVKGRSRRVGTLSLGELRKPNSRCHFITKFSTTAMGRRSSYRKWAAGRGCRRKRRAILLRRLTSLRKQHSASVEE